MQGAASDAATAGNPYTKALAGLLVAAVAYRVLSGPKKDRILPLWVPIEIFVASACLMGGGVWLKLL